MVVSLSGKLTHIAHSLRHGSHSLRNAFPSTANPGFDFTSNVFGTVSNAATGSGSAGAASAIAAGALGAGAGAAASAGSSGGATGGSGGASSKAGSWGANWGFQTGKSVTQGQAAQTDSQLQDDADELRSLAAASTKGRGVVLRPVAARVSSSGLVFRSRRGSISSSSGSLDGTELLRAEEAGLSHVRLSSVEMQRRYHSAFAQGLPTRELEADEMDAALLADADSVAPSDRISGPADVLGSRRRASISNRPTMTLASPFVITTPPAVTPARPSTPSARPVHTSAPAQHPPPPVDIIDSSTVHPVASTSTASTFSSSRPPSPTVPRHRRNSTSAVPSSSASAIEAGPAVALPPRSATPPVQNRRLKIRREKGNRVGAEANRAKAELGSFGWEKSTRVQDGLDSPEASERLNAILAAEKTGKINLVERAVQQYLAHREIWNTATHNAAIAAIYRTRKPNDPLDRIVLLYNQLFDHGALHPNRASYEHVITAFCTRDKEVRESISYLERRIAKRELVNRARGPWHIGFDAAQEDRSGEADERLLNERERERLAELRGPQSDYFSPACEIFQALGKLGDRLHPHVVQSLLVAAAERGQVDTALALFERLEQSAFQKPGYLAYEALVRMYGSIEKDAALVREVFEAYLAARAKGDIVLPRSGNRFSPTVGYRTRTIKHGYDVEPDFVETRVQSVNADERLWQAAILALFDAGDASGAVALVEKLLVTLNAGDAPPSGYPNRLSQRIVQSVVRGFLAQGDEASARTWFDRIAASPESKEQISPAFCGMTLSRAVEADMPDLSNHVYRIMLSCAGRDFPLRVADFALVVDQNLAAAWAAQTPKERETALDAIVEVRSKFEAATKAGCLEEGHGIDYAASTGLLSRICTSMGGFGRFDQASATFAELANLVRTVMRRTPDDEELARQQAKRTRRDWITRITDVATGALGYRRSATFTGPAQLERQTQARPSLHEAIKIVGWTNKLRHVVRWAPRMDHCIAVTESYILARQQENRAPQLTGDEWYVAVEAFAHVAALVRRGTKLDFAFPGFDLVFDDFSASKVEIPVGFDTYDYMALQQALRASGQHPSRIRDIMAVLNYQSAVDSQPNEGLAASLADKAVQPEVTTPVDEVASLASESVGAATSATPNTPGSEPARLPTPPPSPPSYLPDAATAPPSSTIDVFDRVLGKRLEDLAYNGKSLSAFTLAQQAATEGNFAHPDSYGRVIEALGRQHRVDEVRKVYLIAYQALTAMSNKPDEQSVAWVMLEDRMIVALGQAGALVDVGHHRDRLLQAGCAPSADAYAAMILNMRDTTDDAAVALTLFEESQRLNVRPNVYLFNTLISKLSRARRAKEALEYFELMKQFGLRPSSITYGAIINACCKTGDDVSADYLFKEMVSHPDFKPRVPPYNTMIQFYTSVKPSRERALYYYDQLLRAKVPPTAHTYKLLLDAYGGIGEPDLESLQRIFARLVNDKHVSVSGAHWAAMINAYGTVAKQLDRTLAIFDSIREHPTSRGANPNGPQPDAVAYEALFQALIVNGRPDLCDRYLDEMRARHVRMTAYVANNLIKAYSMLGQLDRARAIFFALADPPSGVASAGNHPVDRHPKHHHQGAAGTGTGIAGSAAAAVAMTGVDTPTYREPSTYEAMIRAELAAQEPLRAREILALAELRAFPPAVVARLQKLLAAEGMEVLPLQQYEYQYQDHQQPQPSSSSTPQPYLA